MSQSLRDFVHSLAMEGNEDGTVEKEIETCYICKLKDTSGLLEKAERYEEQEQYEIRTDGKADTNGVKGVIRVRAITDREGSTRYVLTTKVYLKGAKGCNEVELETTKDMFEQIKKMAPIGHKKTRFFFPVEGTDLTWELDLYANEETGSYEPWCRLEIEIPTASTEIPELPYEFEEVIDTSKGKMSEEQKDLVDKLYQEVFIIHKAENFLPITT